MPSPILEPHAWIVATVLLACPIASASQPPAPSQGDAAAVVEPSRTETLAPGQHYQAWWLTRFFFGAQWRDLWTTPIEVPVLDLQTFDGGLQPERRGGGQQTTTLRFYSGKGHVWRFRPLLEAASVLHATPQLAVMPDDPRLGEFRPAFAGMLGMLEERIEREVPGGGKVDETLDLFVRLDEHAGEQVDARNYLRARLIDILVGDCENGKPTCRALTPDGSVRELPVH